jgi:hypothetical protein
MRIVHAALLSVALLPALAHATLGQAPSLPAPAKTAARSLDASSTPASAYTVRESTTSYGLTVREYVLPSNVVFAVTWSGPVRPDMRQLLGSYFPNFATRSDAGHSLGTASRFERSGALVLQSSGHAGDVSGKAYVPRLVPANVDAGALQ